jgi:hypothetical protein
MATKTIITKDTIVFYMDYVLENGENQISISFRKIKRFSNEFYDFSALSKRKEIFKIF